MNTYKHFSKCAHKIYMLCRKAEHKVAVVIPIYKSELSYNELISLDRCLDILNKHQIIVLAPYSLQLDKIQLLKSHKYSTERFSNKYFSSIESYNKLLLSPNFYWRFVCYEYILICQLDAFVLSDQLNKWCDMSYDFIGAPWIGMSFQDEIESTANKLYRKYFCKISNVGNGGFSLRKVNKFIITLTLFRKLAAEWKFNEDLFWAYEVPALLPFFSIPDEAIALDFSFELEPSKCYELNNHKLPFGCHAWCKYDIDFWRPFFKKYGYTI